MSVVLFDCIMFNQIYMHRDFYLLFIYIIQLKNLTFYFCGFVPELFFVPCHISDIFIGSKLCMKASFKRISEFNNTYQYNSWFCYMQSNKKKMRSVNAFLSINT